MSDQIWREAAKRNLKASTPVGLVPAFELWGMADTQLKDTYIRAKAIADESTPFSADEVTTKQSDAKLILALLSDIAADRKLEKERNTLARELTRAKENLIRSRERANANKSPDELDVEIQEIETRLNSLVN